MHRRSSTEVPVTRVVTAGIVECTFNRIADADPGMHPDVFRVDMIRSRNFLEWNTRGEYSAGEITAE